MKEPDYRDWIEAHGTQLTPEQYASHLHLLDEVIALRRMLDGFMRRHDHAGSFAHGVVLTAAQRQSFQDVIDVLKRLEYPVVLLQARAPKAPLRLPRK